MSKSGFSIVVALLCCSLFPLGMCAQAKEQKLSREEAQNYAEAAWQAAQQRHRAEHHAMWEGRTLEHASYSMPFDVRVYGDKPSDGRSLYISMHGGGNTTQAVNNQQWRNQMTLYRPAEGVYIAPRAAVDDWNMWFRPHIDTLFAKLIQCAVYELDVNPNKVYLMGYSAGGDGAYRMAPRLADHWAAASMMAGHPGEASPLNLRNIGFMVWMGENDAAYNRNLLAVEYGRVLDSLQTADVEGYPHQTTLVKGCGHWMNRADTAAVAWMQEYVRNPYPRCIVWRQEESGLRDCFYNLGIPRHEMAKGKQLRVKYEGNTVHVLHSDYDTFFIHFNDYMVDLSKPIMVTLNGKRIFKGKLPRKASHIDASIGKRMDSAYIFSAMIEVQGDRVVVR